MFMQVITQMTDKKVLKRAMERRRNLSIIFSLFSFNSNIQDCNEKSVHFYIFNIL
jgi:hypothetical protein